MVTWKVPHSDVILKLDQRSGATVRDPQYCWAAAQEIAYSPPGQKCILAAQASSNLEACMSTAMQLTVCWLPNAQPVLRAQLTCTVYLPLVRGQPTAHVKAHWTLSPCTLVSHVQLTPTCIDWQPDDRLALTRSWYYQASRWIRKQIFSKDTRLFLKNLLCILL